MSLDAALASAHTKPATAEERAKPIRGATDSGSTDLDWATFSARNFPGRRPRHDFQAIRAYAAFKEGRAPVLEAGAENGADAQKKPFRSIVRGAGGETLGER